MLPSGKHEFLTGPAKFFLYLRVVIHVVAHFTLQVCRGRLPIFTYPISLYRAWLFLNAVRHNKVVRRGKNYKLHLYFPAYPGRAFFHTLEKLYRPEPGPVTVVLSMTRACNYSCPHCYQGRDRGKDLELDRLLTATREMQDAGVSLFDIEGGEPLLRFPRLYALISAIDERGEIWLNTTGADLTDEGAAALVTAGLAGVMISLHRPDAAAHDAFTGVAGSFASAQIALKKIAGLGAFTVINCCPDREMIAGDGLARILALGREWGCDFVQVIHNKAAGLWLGRADEVAGTPELLTKLLAIHNDYNSGGKYKEHPAAAVQVCEERPELFGCTAGGVDRFYLGADGEVQPCEFLNVSCGNLRDDDFATIYARMRAAFKQPCADWLCCTQAAGINEIIKKHDLKRTPVPWEITRTFIEQWDRGKPTPLYKKLGIYK